MLKAFIIAGACIALVTLIVLVVAIILVAKQLKALRNQNKALEERDYQWAKQRAEEIVKENEERERLEAEQRAKKEERTIIIQRAVVDKVEVEVPEIEKQDGCYVKVQGLENGDTVKITAEQPASEESAKEVQPSQEQPVQQAVEEVVVVEESVAPAQEETVAEEIAEQQVEEPVKEDCPAENVEVEEQPVIDEKIEEPIIVVDDAILAPSDDSAEDIDAKQKEIDEMINKLINS